MRRHHLIVFALGCSLVTGCTDEEAFVYSSFREAALETTPVVAATATRPAVAAAVDPPGVLKAVFQLLQSYDPATDQGVDMTNLYRVLETADQAFEITRECVEGEARAIASPFPLGVDDTYTCAVNNHKDEPTGASGAAIREDGGSHHALLAYRTTDAESSALGVVQGFHDDLTGEVAIEMATVVRYPVVTPTKGLGFGLRTSILGNKLSHDFELRALVRDVDDPEDTMWDTISIVGAGNSQLLGGAFLLRITASGQSIVDGRYYCVSVGTDATALAALDPAGTAEPDAACAALRARVDALTFYERDDAPGELAAFTGSDAYLPL